MMRARRSGRIPFVVAAVAMAAGLLVMPGSSAGAALPGSFDGDKLCDNSFETEGQTGPSRPNLSGPCWFDLGGVESVPLFTTAEKFTGLRSLELCGDIGCDEGIAREIVIPYGITDATLSGHFLRTGGDSTPDSCESTFEFSDYVYVILQADGDPGSSETNFVVMCETAGVGWQHLEQDVAAYLSEFEGRTATVIVASHTSESDGGEQFYADDIHLEITAQGQAMTTYTRKATLSLKNHVKASGRISSIDEGVWAGCWAGVTVHFERKKGTEWVRLTKKTTTDPEGFYTVLLPDKQGTYRAVVERTPLDVAHRCAKVVSPVRTHQH